MFRKTVVFLFFVCSGCLLVFGTNLLYQQSKVKQLNFLVDEYQKFSTKMRRESKDNLVNKYLCFRVLQKLKQDALSLDGEGAKKLYMKNRSFWDNLESEMEHLQNEDFSSLSEQSRDAVEKEVVKLFEK